MPRHAEPPPPRSAGQVYQSGEWATQQGQRGQRDQRGQRGQRGYEPEWDAYAGYDDDADDVNGWEDRRSARRRTLPSGREVPQRQPSRTMVDSVRDYLPGEREYGEREEGERGSGRRRMLGAAVVGGVLALVGERLVGVFTAAGTKTGGTGCNAAGGGASGAIVL